MNSLLVHLWNRLRSSYWLIPSLMAVGAILLSILCLGLDGLIQLNLEGGLSRIFANSGDGARSVLSTIAGSMITVAGVVLSTTIVVLTLASQQFGPRLVQNFIKDRPSQFVIGCFVGCFIYNILILQAIRSGEGQFVPHFSVLAGVLLAILCIGCLIFFIHHISVEIQVQSIMRRVKNDLDASIDRMFPRKLGEPAESPGKGVAAEGSEGEGAASEPILASRAGYVQAIRYDRLMELCVDHDWKVEITAGPGSFAIEGEPVGRVFAAEATSDEALESLQSVFVVGTFPTSEQDILFPLNQLEEMAIRALSPGINDPHTAIECVDHMAASLSRLLEREWPSSERLDESGRLRVIARPHSFERVLREGFQQVHHYGVGDLTVVRRILRALVKLGVHPAAPSDRVRVVERLIHELYEKSQAGMPHEIDRKMLSESYEGFEAELAGRPPAQGAGSNP